MASMRRLENLVGHRARPPATAAFGLLWKWDGWHYRYRFLALAYAVMVLGFVGIVLKVDHLTAAVAGV